MEICKICGKELAEGSRYCSCCGTAVNAKQVVVSVCPKCGGKYKGVFTFCPRCGYHNPNAPKPKDTKIDESHHLEEHKGNPSEFKMMPIPKASFNMGNADTRIVSVELSPFFMSNILITQDIYQRVTGHNPSKIKGAQLPV